MFLALFQHFELMQLCIELLTCMIVKFFSSISKCNSISDQFSVLMLKHKMH